MPDGVEVERKWLIAAIPPAAALAAPAQRIDQGYLTIGADGDETRLRSRAGEYVLTIKSGSGLVRSETSVNLTVEQFDQLWPATAGARVEKLRHLIPGPGGTTIELDVYAGALEGLVVAEVEFDEPEAAAAFEPPDWFGPDVTTDGRYKNHSLAVNGIPD